MNKIIVFIVAIIASINFVLLLSGNGIKVSDGNRVSQKVLGIKNQENILNSVNADLIQSSYLSPEFQDYRAFVLDKYFESYESPLRGFGSEFIVACDKYGLSADCSVIPAIAFAETRLCTQALALKQFNCWGFGGSNEKRIIFNDFTESIDYVTKTLAKGYGNWLFNPEAIDDYYCGINCVNWATSVNQQRQAIQNIASSLNLPSIKK